MGTGFDMDGTLISETTEYYMEWYVYLYRVFDDPSYNATDQQKEHAAWIREGMLNRAVTGQMNDVQTAEKIQVLAGLNEDEMRRVVNEVCQQNAGGLTNLKRGETFYLPMMEVIAYLKQNKFEVYVVSAADRDIARFFVDGVLPIRKANVIGADTSYCGLNQGEKQSWGYTFQKDTDEIVRTDFVGNRNYAMDRATNIYKEIGQCPVLSFGNSSGDASMHQYTLSNKKYKTLAFQLCCDNVVLEYGDEAKAERTRKTCEANGWIPVSMKDDWSTIYGEGVYKTVDPDLEK